MNNFIDIIKKNASFCRQIPFGENVFLEYNCPITDKFISLWSTHNCLMYITSGKKTVYSTDREWEQKQGDCFFMKKGAYLLEQCFDEPYQSLNFIFTDGFLRAYVNAFAKQLDNQKGQDRLSAASYPVIPLERSGIFESIFKSSLAYFENPLPTNNTQLELKLQELLTNCLMYDENGNLYRYMIEISKENGDSLRTIMEDNYCFGLKLEDYATLCNRSLASFKRDFQKEFHTSPGEWIRKRRVEKARVLLKTTSKSIAQIGFEVGYEENSNFTRTFKRVAGCTPNTYRNNHPQTVI